MQPLKLITAITESPDRVDIEGVFSLTDCGDSLLQSGQMHFLIGFPTVVWKIKQENNSHFKSNFHSERLQITCLLPNSPSLRCLKGNGDVCRFISSRQTKNTDLLDASSHGEPAPPCWAHGRLGVSHSETEEGTFQTPAAAGYGETHFDRPALKGTRKDLTPFINLQSSESSF